MSALSNRAKYRARHGLEISLRLSLPDRLSFHAAGGLLDRGYAKLGCTSVSRMPRTRGLDQILCLQHGENIQVKLVIVKTKLVLGFAVWLEMDGEAGRYRMGTLTNGTSPSR